MVPVDILPPVSSSKDSDTLSVSAFIFTPQFQQYVSQSPQSKLPSTTKIDKPSKPVLDNQRIGNSERQVKNIDKVKVSKNKRKVSNRDGIGKENEGPQGRRRIIKWSEDDEIVLLGRIIDYKAETGDDVNSKFEAFNESVKDFLSVRLTKSQVYEKIRRLKKKFQINDNKCKNGEAHVFSRPHENKLFEISQKIWGSSEGNDSEAVSGMNMGKRDEIVVGTAGMLLKSWIANKEEETITTKDDKEEIPNCWLLYPLLCAFLESEFYGYLRAVDTKDYVKKIIIGIGEEKASQMEDEWKAFYVMDHQLYARRTYLNSELANATLDWLKHF